MSACQCNYGGSSFLGWCVMRNRTARSIPKSGNICPNCDKPVEIGQRCIDVAGLYADDHSGTFDRFHESCYLLMERYADALCDGQWFYPFDLDEAADHAVAHSHDPYWREWLELYETTWAWTPEPVGLELEKWRAELAQELEARRE